MGSRGWIHIHLQGKMKLQDLHKQLILIQDSDELELGNTYYYAYNERMDVISFILIKRHDHGQHTWYNIKENRMETFKIGYIYKMV